MAGGRSSPSLGHVTGPTRYPAHSFLQITGLELSPDFLMLPGCRFQSVLLKNNTALLFAPSYLHSGVHDNNIVGPCRCRSERRSADRTEVCSSRAMPIPITTAPWIWLRPAMG